IYTAPYDFLNGPTTAYESYPWARLGGNTAPGGTASTWQLNIPWMTAANRPLYIHLWDGGGYRIPSNFWTGLTSTFENHQGQQFVMTRNADGTIILRDKAGTSYNFDTGHKLVSIIDMIGNTI